jgi:outer membrane protein OmpA-like peptidoglycan-associated protein
MKKRNSIENSGSYIEDQWISLSDLMTGLMMLFLLIAASYMVKLEADQAKIREVAILYNKTKKELYDDLKKEFKSDIRQWGAEIDDNLTITFKEPDVLFLLGKDELRPKFKEILQDFFPRYLKIITSEKYKNSIQEIRIEGHTSTIWNNLVSENDAYFYNMDLSQARTRSVLKFIFKLPEVQDNSEWIKSYITANGLSSSRIILKEDGGEDFKKSQRVEFRIITDSEQKMAKIIESIQ